MSRLRVVAALCVTCLALLFLLPDLLVKEKPKGASSPYRRWAVLADPQLQAEGLGDLVATDLSGRADLQVVERERLQSLVDEASMQAALTGDDVASRLRLGELLGADGLVILRLEQTQAPAAQQPSAVPPVGFTRAWMEEVAKKPALPVTSDKKIKVTVSDCRQGARLRLEHLGYRRQDMPDVARQVSQIVEAVREQYATGLQRVVGLSPFVCRNLSHEYDQYQASFAHLLAEALAAPGTAVIDAQEAQAIGAERNLTGASPIERVVPLFIEAEYEVLQGRQADEPPVRLSVGLRRSDQRLQTVRGNDVPLGQVGRFLAEQVAPAVRKAIGGQGLAPLSNESQAERLAARAAEFESLGMWSLAAELREALLLIQPEDHTQRTMLLEDYGRALSDDRPPTPARGSWANSPTEYDLRSFNVWCQERAGLFRCCLDHLEYLIRHEGIARQAAVELTHTVLRIAPAIPNDLADRQAAVVQPLEEQKKQFLRTAYRDILQLPLAKEAGQKSKAIDEQAFQEWQGTLTIWSFVRLDGRTFGPEDLGFARQVLTEEIPDYQRPAYGVLFFLQHQAVPYQIDPSGQATYSLCQGCRYRYSEQEYMEFLRHLAASEVPLTSIYGRYGLLQHLYDRSGIRATQEMLTEAGAIIDLYTKSQEGLGRPAKRYSQFYQALTDLRDGIQVRLAEAPPATQAQEGLASGRAAASIPVSAALTARAQAVATHSVARVTSRLVELRLRNAAARTAPLHAGGMKIGPMPGNWMQVRPCGDQLDIWWTDSVAALMREPGRLDVIFQADGRGSIRDVCWDGQVAWVATGDGRVWVVEPDGSQATEAGREMPANGIVATGLHAIGTGRVLCVRAWDADPRITCTLLEWSGSTAKQRLIYKVPGPPEYSAVGIRNTAQVQCSPGQSLIWMFEPVGKKQSRTLQVGLWGELKTKIRGFPLAIDLGTLEVTPLPVRQETSHDPLLSADGCLWSVDAHKDSIWRRSAGSEDGDERAPQAVLPQEQVYPGGALVPHLLVRNGAVYAAGAIWHRLYADLNVSRVLGPLLLPGSDTPGNRYMPAQSTFWQYGQSAHYGLLTWSQEQPIYQVTVEDPPRADSDDQSAEVNRPAGLTFAVLAEGSRLSERIATGLQQMLPAGPEPVRLAAMQEVVHDLVQPQGRALRQRLGRAFGVDYLLVEHRQQGSVSLVSLSDARTGMQLLTESLTRQQRNDPQADPLTSKKIRDLVQRLSAKPLRPVALARLTPLDAGNDPYGEALTYVLSKALGTHEQLVVTAAAEMAPPARSSSADETAAGTLMRGNYVLTPATGKDRPRLSIRLEVLEDSGERQTVQAEDAPAETIAQVYRRLCGLLGIRSTDDTRSVADRACRSLMARADELARVGRTARACDLLQTCLLLEPEAPEVRLALLRRQLTLLYWPPAEEAHCQMDRASFNVWLRQRVDRWRMLTHQLAELVSGGGISRGMAGKAAEAALALPAQAGWDRDLPELEADRQQLRETIRQRIGWLAPEAKGQDDPAAERQAGQEELLAQASAPPNSPLPATGQDRGRIVRLVPIELQVRMHPDRERPMQLSDNMPIEEQIKRHNARRVVSMLAIAAFNMESGFGRGERWQWTTGGDTDVLWSDRSVVSVPRPDAATEIVAGYDLAISDVRCDGQRIWVADQKKGITVFNPAGELLAHVGQAEGLPPADQALLVYPLGEGKSLACGSLGTEQRAWIAVIDLAGPQVQVIHRATRVLARSVTAVSAGSSQQAPGRPGKRMQPQVDAACLPQWILPIGPRTFLIGRGPSRYAASSSWLPLRVDLASGQVSVFDPQCANPWGRDVDYLALHGGLYAADGDHLWQWAGLDKAWDDGLAWRLIAERDWQRSSPDESLVMSMAHVSVLPIDKRLYLPGWEILQRDEENHVGPIDSLWKEYDPASGVTQPLPREVVPAFPIVPHGYAVSARFGPVMWGWSRAPQMGEEPLTPTDSVLERPVAQRDRAETWRKTVADGRFVLFRVQLINAARADGHGRDDRPADGTESAHPTPVSERPGAQSTVGRRNGP